MNARARLRRQAGPRGFTLLELLLTVVLITLLMGAMVVNFSGMQAATQLDESAEQLESAIRYARAHAANTGCKVRIMFEEQVDEEMSAPLGNMFVEWEPDPTGQPGIFQPLHDLDQLLESMLQGVEISDVISEAGWDQAVITGSAEGETAAEAGSEAPPSFAPITFYPDGSSDSAEIILTSRDPEQTRKISVQIIGATGVIRKTVLSAEARSAEEQDWNEMIGQ